jgi:hypothetical protein
MLLTIDFSAYEMYTYIQYECNEGIELTKTFKVVQKMFLN